MRRALALTTKRVEQVEQIGNVTGKGRGTPEVPNHHEANEMNEARPSVVRGDTTPNGAMAFISHTFASWRLSSSAAHRALFAHRPNLLDLLDPLRRPYHAPIQTSDNFLGKNCRCGRNFRLERCGHHKYFAQNAPGMNV